MMNKEEILTRSRKESRDEGLLEAENKGRRLGVTAFGVMFFAIVFFNLWKGIDNYSVMALFWAFMAAETYPKYKFTKKGAYLATVITGSSAAICSFAAHILSVMR